MVEPDNREGLSISKQCRLLGISRSSWYYKAKGPSEYDLELMKAIDEQYLKTPCYGKRRMTCALRRQGYRVGIKKVKGLMERMGLEAIYPRPRTSRRNKGHKIYPYLLRGLNIKDPNHVWCSDITYIPISGGYMYLCVIMDWYSKKVLSWSLSNTLDSEFCVSCLERAIMDYGVPEIFNSDQGCQYTSKAFVGTLNRQGIKISMDGRGRFHDNIFVERLWRSLKYELIYTKLLMRSMNLQRLLKQALISEGEQKMPKMLSENRGPFQLSRSILKVVRTLTFPLNSPLNSPLSAVRLSKMRRPWSS